MTMKPCKAKGSKLTTSQYMAYSLPHMSTLFLIAPIGILQGVYSKYYGMTLTTLAAVILFSRLFDAVTDPLIGYFSDRYRTRTGTRKPFVLAGGLLFAVGGYFLYVPPDNPTVVYFSVSFVLFYLGWTLFEVPHLAWASELATETHEKNKIFGFRTATGYVGALFFYAIPLLPFFSTSDITPETLRWCAISAGLLILPTLYLCIRTIPDGYYVPNVDERINQCPSNKKQDLKLLLKTIIHNRPFLQFLGAYAFYGIGVGMWAGLIFIYVDAYLGMGNEFAKMYLIAFAIGIAVTPLWCKVAGWVGKKNTWSLAILLVVVSFIYTGLLQPGETSFVELLTLKIINTLGFVCLIMIAPSMLSDIVDYSTWKFGENRTGLYFSIKALMGKTVGGLGAGLGLAIAGVYGFEPASAGQTEAGVWGLNLAISWLPAVLLMISLVFVMSMSIIPRRHSIIRRRLNAIENRVKRDSISSNSTKTKPKPKEGVASYAG